MKILMISGGSIDYDYAFSCIKEHTYDEIIAIDGGMAFADSMKLPVTHLVGDFDTIQKDLLDRYVNEGAITIHRYKPEKDYTDTDIAIKLAIKLFGQHEEKVLDIWGGTGTRLDHVMANLQMLKQLLVHGIKAVVYDKNNRIEMIGEGTVVVPKASFGKYVSIVPVTEFVDGLTLTGFKYPLTNAGTKFGESLCISNEIVDPKGMITIEKGMAWLIMSRD